MPSPLFETVPREIRDQIWTHLTSPTGFIALEPILPRAGWPGQPRSTLRIFPYDPKQKELLLDHDIKLSFLRVCRQLYAECKHLLWKCNALRVQQARDLDDFMRWRSLATELRQHIRHIEIDVVDPRNRTYGIFAENLVDWSRVGSLRKLTLTSSLGITNSFFHKLSPRKEEILLLCNTNRVDGNGSPPGLEKQMIMETGLAAMSPEDEVEWFRENMLKDRSIFAKELHGAFGGEIWIDGVLYSEDGVEIP